MVIETGVIKFTEADSRNIPVDIMLLFVKKHWELTANNYMPRKNRLEERAFCATGTREELQKLVENHVLPLYQEVVQQVQNICDGKAVSL